MWFSARPLFSLECPKLKYSKPALSFAIIVENKEDKASVDFQYGVAEMYCAKEVLLALNKVVPPIILAPS